MKLVVSFASLQHTAVLQETSVQRKDDNVSRNRGSGRGHSCTQAIITSEKKHTYCIYLHPRLSEQENVQSLMKSPSTCLKPVLIWWDPLSPTIYHRQHNQAKRSLLQVEHPSLHSIPYLALLQDRGWKDSAGLTFEPGATGHLKRRLLFLEQHLAQILDFEVSFAWCICLEIY